MLSSPVLERRIGCRTVAVSRPVEPGQSIDVKSKEICGKQRVIANSMPLSTPKRNVHRGVHTMQCTLPKLSKRSSFSKQKTNFLPYGNRHRNELAGYLAWWLARLSRTSIIARKTRHLVSGWHG